MDENTKHIVASNLTIAFCSNRPVPMVAALREATHEKGIPNDMPLQESDVLRIYHYFLQLLEIDVNSNS
jgi:hypothetical protein